MVDRINILYPIKNQAHPNPPPLHPSPLTITSPLVITIALPLVGLLFELGVVGPENIAKTLKSRNRP